MKVVIVGSGAREHALALAVSASPLLSSLACVPGNGGTLAWNVEAPSPFEPKVFAEWAAARGTDLVVVGPEAPLAGGLADALLAAGVPTFGPMEAGAMLESSKAFAKGFMDRHGIPTARWRRVANDDEARAAIADLCGPNGVVIKADGLAGGKGVVVADDPFSAATAAANLLRGDAVGDAGRTVVIEERLFGPELSFHALIDESGWRALPTARDHKTLLEGGRGPNTGGMGVVAPVELPEQTRLTIESRILDALLRGMRAENIPYRGVIFVGLMLTAAGPRVLEFNCRFGDPEATVLLPAIRSDVLALLAATARGELSTATVEVDATIRVAVVAAQPGYPGRVPTGVLIEGLADAANAPDVDLLHAGTRCDGEGRCITAGGRVLVAVAEGATVAVARTRAYSALDPIHFGGMQPVIRRDIGLVS